MGDWFGLLGFLRLFWRLGVFFMFLVLRLLFLLLCFFLGFGFILQPFLFFLNLLLFFLLGLALFLFLFFSLLLGFLLVLLCFFLFFLGLFFLFLGLFFLFPCQFFKLLLLFGFLQQLRFELLSLSLPFQLLLRKLFLKLPLFLCFLLSCFLGSLVWN